MDNGLIYLVAQIYLHVIYFYIYNIFTFNYIGETIRNAVTRIYEQEQSNGKLEPSKHLNNNPGH